MDLSADTGKRQISGLRSEGEGDCARVAGAVPRQPGKRFVRFGTMRGRIHLKPSWDYPIDIDKFLSGE